MRDVNFVVIFSKNFRRYDTENSSQCYTTNDENDLDIWKPETEQKQ